MKKAGFTYLYVLFFLSILSTLSLLLYNYTTRELRLTQSKIENANVYNAVRSAVDIGVFTIYQTLQENKTAIYLQAEEAYLTQEETPDDDFYTLGELLDKFAFLSLSGLLTEKLTVPIHDYTAQISFVWEEGDDFTYTFTITATCARTSDPFPVSTLVLTGEFSYEGVYPLILSQLF